MSKPSHFQSEFDKVLSGFVKEAGGPPPLPDDVYELNPWADVEGEEKPIGSMSKEELANFVKNLDDKTFEELKVVLEKVDMPEADDVQEINDRHTRPTVETLVESDEMKEFVSSPAFEVAFNHWLAQKDMPERMQQTYNQMPENEKAWLEGLKDYPETDEADDMKELVEDVKGPEKTVGDAMEELPAVERDDFLKKLRLSKRQ